MKHLIFTVLFCAFSISSQAKIYKCVGSDGRVTYANEERGCEKNLDYLTREKNSAVITNESNGNKTQVKSREVVYVKYRGEVDLEPFNCDSVSRSSLIKRLCYDSKEEYVIVSLKGTYYHYCEVPPSIVTQWLSAPSIGKYYSREIKGKYDCRINRVPSYDQ